MDEKMKIMHEKVANMQNAFWKAYKNLLETGDMTQANQDLKRILEEYRNDSILFSACQWFSGGWCIIDNEIKKIMGIEGNKSQREK